jgi:hypothetical protein
MLLDVKCVFRVSVQLVSVTFFILRRIKREIIKNVYWSLRIVPVILVPILMKLEFFGQVFEKY